MKKKLQRFCTQTHQEAGFTLVELIVVIAILAILAGIAVPAYNGYIAKAERAGDEQLLAAVNQAFAAACAMSGEDHYNRKDVEVQMNDIEGGKEVAVTVSGIADFNEDFTKFYEGGTFKVISELFYNPNQGGFAENAVLTFNFGGTSISLSSKDVAILSGDNAFSNRGSAALLADVGTLENLLETGMGEDVLTSVKQSDEFLWAIGSYAGMTQGEDEDDDTYLDRVAGYVMNPDNENAVYSAQIMFAASQAATVTTDQLSSLFNNGTVTSNIEVKNDGVTDYNATMANAALAYGMYTAYQQQYPDAENVDNFTLTVNSTAFQTYYNSEQGQNDLEAYMAAMSMISDNTSNSEVTTSILNNGITGNTDLAELMKEVMGN